MSAEIVTKDDLELFRIRLISEIKSIVEVRLQPPPERPEGYKTSDVRKMLGCSVNKLVSLRITRKIRTKKIGGTIYYNKDDIKRLLEEGY
ncbi:MAG: helix-turn-helix domain-containing protein [Terrimonas sp.]|nr:helix-turn-helix domain-containing protein [Terrimonas sp.]